MHDRQLLDNREHNVRLLSFLAEKWFRILEYSLLMGVLQVVASTTHNIVVRIVYGISWVVFFWLFIEAGEYIAQRYYVHRGSVRSSARLIIWAIAIFIALFWFMVIKDTGEFISCLLNEQTCKV